MLTLRWAGVCAECESVLPAGTRAAWDPVSRTVTCIRCLSDGGGHPAGERHLTSAEIGSAGVSATHEHQRRKHKREARTLEVHPWIGRVLLALRDAPVSETAFRDGAAQERIVARTLERRTAGRPAIILNDRRMPRGLGNIDHIAVTPCGVFVIDTKGHHGKVRLDHPRLGTPLLRIAGRDSTRLLEGLDRQVEAVGAALAVDRPELPIQGVLCFTKAELPPLLPLRVGGHLLLHPRGLARKLNASGPLEPAGIEDVALTLASAFPHTALGAQTPSAPLSLAQAARCRLPTGRRTPRSR